MLFIEANNINEVYYKLINNVYDNGRTLVKENGVVLKEIVPSIIKLTNPSYSVITHNGRPYNVAFMIAETLWNLCGETSDWLCRYNEMYSQYYTDGELTAGYGNRIFNRFGNQFIQAAELLKSDKDTSHVTISICSPYDDLTESKFVPCISFIEYRVIDNKLIMFTRMRAQDLWRGFPYDINLLIMLFSYMSHLTGYEMGVYYHDCRAIRLYETDFDDVIRFLNNNSEYGESEKIEIPRITNLPDTLLLYRNILNDNIIFDIKMLDDENSYWKNGILSCMIYRLIHNHQFDEADRYLQLISNTFKRQIIIWSKRYYCSFYQFLFNKRGDPNK